MTKKELLELINDYHDNDEVVVRSKSLKMGNVVGLDFEEMNKRGCIVIKLDWNDDISDEESSRGKRGVRVELVRGVTKYGAIKMCPWAKAFAKVEDGFICFEDERSYDAWRKKKSKEKYEAKSKAVKKSKKKGTDTVNDELNNFMGLI